MKQIVFLTVAVKKVRSIGHVLKGNPGGVFGRVISKPFDEKLGPAASCAMVQDGFDLVLDFSVNNFGIRRRFCSTTQRLRGGQVRFEAVNMKNIMDAHSGGEFDLEGDW
jgi:hypothetical protein